MKTTDLDEVAPGVFASTPTMEDRVKAGVAEMGAAFVKAGIGNDLQAMLASTAILLGTIAAAFPDDEKALVAAISSARNVMQRLNA